MLCCCAEACLLHRFRVLMCLVSDLVKSFMNCSWSREGSRGLHYWRLHLSLTATINQGSAFGPRAPQPPNTLDRAWGFSKKHSSGCHGEGWMTSFRLGSQPRPPSPSHFLPSPHSAPPPLILSIKPPPSLPLLFSPLISCPFSENLCSPRLPSSNH